MAKKKKFENMTKAEQRVAIAKDVQKQIYIGRVKATHGVYVGCLRITGDAEPGENCTACALGALFVSKYELSNGEWPDDMGQGELRMALHPYFTIFQLCEIEDAFEQKYPRWSDLDDPEDCMIAIFQNIIDHDGTFKPSVEYEMVQETEDE